MSRLLFALVLIWLSVIAAANIVKLRGRTVSLGDAPTASHILKRSAGAESEVDQYLVVVYRRLSSSEREKLENIAGSPFLYYFQDNAFLVVTTRAQAAALQSDEHVQKVVLYQAEWRVDPAVQQHNTSRNESSKRTFVALLIKSSKLPTADVLAQQWQEALNSQFGEGIVHIDMPTGSSRAIQFTISSQVDSATVQAVLAWISRQSATHFVEERRVNRLMNNSAKWLIQSNQRNHLPFWDANIDGTGQIVGFADTGLDADHCFFADPNAAPPYDTIDMSQRKIVAYWRYSDTDYKDSLNGHGTHVGGSIAGYPVVGAGGASGEEVDQSVPFAGMARGAKLAFLDIQKSPSGRGEPEEPLRTPSDLGADLLKDFYDIGVRIHSDSWGCYDPNPARCNVYDIQAATLDEFVYGNDDLVVVFAAGNAAGQSENHGFATVGTPATAKNCLTVGSSMNDYAQSWRNITTYIDFQEVVDLVREQLINLDYCTEDGETPCPQTPEDCCDWSGPIDISLICCPSAVQRDIDTHPEKYNSDNLSGFSSRGPASDGHRIKPDVVAPGEYIVSSRSDGKSGDTPQCGLQMVVALQGTSMACPLVAGTAALVRQYFVDGWWPSGSPNSQVDGFNPSAALVRAVIVNSAQPLDGTVQLTLDSKPVPLADFDQASRQFLEGFGKVQLNTALPIGNQSLLSLWLHDNRNLALEHQGVATYVGVVQSALLPLSVTLAWTDPPSSPNSDGSLINDMDLEVELVDGRFYGNGGDSPDRYSNVEKVVVQQPTPGQFVVYVRGANVNRGPQRYALVINGDISHNVTYTIIHGAPKPSSAATLSPAWLFCVLFLVVAAAVFVLF